MIDDLLEPVTEEQLHAIRNFLSDLPCSFEVISTPWKETDFYSTLTTSTGPDKMPRFNPNPNTISSTFVTLPKGDYRLSIGEPKPYMQDRGDAGKVYGVRYPLTVVGGEYDGKTIFFSGEMFNEDGSPSMGAGGTKRFLMAALGYEINDENESRFNADTENEDWGFDVADGNGSESYIGEMWLKAKGCGVEASLDINPSKKDPEKFYQKFVGWFPAGE